MNVNNIHSLHLEINASSVTNFSPFFEAIISLGAILRTVIAFFLPRRKVPKYGW